MHLTRIQRQVLRYIWQRTKQFCLVILLCQLSNTLHADMCFSSFENDTSKCEAIFIGKVVDIRYYSFWHFGTPKSVYTFQVSESFKGLDEYDSFISIIGPYGGCCIDNYLQDSVYMIFAYGPDFLYTNDCSCSGLLTKCEGYRKLLKKPVIHNEAPWQLDFIMAERHLLDSLRISNLEIKNKLNVSESQNRCQRNWLIVLIAAIVSLVCVLCYKRFKSIFSANRR